MGKDSEHLNQCKADQSLFGPFDVWLKNSLVHSIPSWIHPNHLTMASLLWIALSCLASYLVVSRGNVERLWLVVLALLGHYITDLLDGELGRVRKTGYILWGFYMDHFFDYIFFVAIVGSLYFVVPFALQGLFVVLGLVVSMLFVHIHISAIVQDAFVISFCRIGPSELRILTVIFVLGIMYTPSLLSFVVPLVCLFVLIVFVVALYNTQKKLALQDMKNKFG